VKLVVSRWAAADIERLRVFLEDKNRAAAERAGSFFRAPFNPLAIYPIADDRPASPASLLRRTARFSPRCGRQITARFRDY
jgi:hypothetical protein